MTEYFKERRRERRNRHRISHFNGNSSINGEKFAGWPEGGEFCLHSSFGADKSMADNKIVEQSSATEKIK